MKITHHKNGEIKTLVEEAPYHPGYEDAGFKPNLIKSRVNELADWILDEVRHADEAEEIATMLRQQQAEIEALNGRIDRLIENASHHEGIAHAGGFAQGHEVGRQLGMKQERALWNLSESTQEIMNAHPVKELTDDEIIEVHVKTPFIDGYLNKNLIEFAKAILRKASEK